MEKTPSTFAGFYTNENLGFDLKIIFKSYQVYKTFFKGSVALELGSSTGYMTKLLKDDFKELHIVDGADELLKQIPDYENVIKTHSLFEKYNPTITFDTIILNNVLEHIEHPVELLIKIGNWLNKDGVFILGVPNAKSFHRLAGVKMGMLKSEFELNDRDHELGHYRVYDFELLRQHIAQAGLQIVHEGGVFLKFVSNGQIEKYFDEKLIDAYFKLSDDFKNNCASIFVVIKK